jgi:succinate dehydrogenase/fumarate reductase cytochrome b subunit
MYSVIVIPINLGFEPKITPFFEKVDILILCAFSLDILANFNTTYYDTDLEITVVNRRMIAQNYLQFWFWIDILSTFPFDYIQTGSDVGAVRVIRALRLFRIMKLVRVSKFSEVLQRYRVDPNLINFFVLLMGIFFVAHIFACIWHYLAIIGKDNGWVYKLDYEDASIYERYIASIYYILVTMMTIGYGDIHPVNHTERIFAIATMLVGGVVFGALIAKLASILEKSNPEAKALASNMSELKTYLIEVAVSNETRKKVVVRC